MKMVLTTLDIINLTIMVVLLVEAVFFVRIMLRKYRESKNVVNLYFVVLIIDLFGAGICIFLEQISFDILLNDPLGRIFGTVLLIPTTIAGIIVNLIAFELTYPKKKRLLIIPIIILILIVDVAMAYAILSGVAVEVGGVIADYGIYTPIILIAEIPVFFAPLGTFFYFSYVTRKTSPPKSKRSFWLGFALLLFAVPYVSELIYRPPEIAVPLRGLYLISATLLFICFAMPEWFKKYLKWEDFT